MPPSDFPLLPNLRVFLTKLPRRFVFTGLVFGLTLTGFLPPPVVPPGPPLPAVFFSLLCLFLRLSLKLVKTFLNAARVFPGLSRKFIPKNAAPITPNAFKNPVSLSQGVASSLSRSYIPSMNVTTADLINQEKKSTTFLIPSRIEMTFS